MPVRFMRQDFFEITAAMHVMGVHQFASDPSHGGQRYQAEAPNLAL